jgi:hypothetical protein
MAPINDSSDFICFRYNILFRTCRFQEEDSDHIKQTNRAFIDSTSFCQSKRNAKSPWQQYRSSPLVLMGETDKTHIPTRSQKTETRQKQGPIRGHKHKCESYNVKKMCHFPIFLSALWCKVLLSFIARQEYAGNLIVTMGCSPNP